MVVPPLGNILPRVQFCILGVSGFLSTRSLVAILQHSGLEYM